MVTYHPPNSFIKMLIISTFSFPFISSCTKNIGPTPSSNPQLPNLVTLSQHIQPIFNANCNATGCHTGGSQAAAKLDLTQGNSRAYLFLKQDIDTLQPTTCTLMIELNNSLMPKNALALSSYNISLIQKWIQQGAKP